MPHNHAHAVVRCISYIYACTCALIFTAWCDEIVCKALEELAFVLYLSIRCNAGTPNPRLGPGQWAGGSNGHVVGGCDCGVLLWRGEVHLQQSHSAMMYGGVCPWEVSEASTRFRFQVTLTSNVALGTCATHKHIERTRICFCIKFASLLHTSVDKVITYLPFGGISAIGLPYGTHLYHVTATFGNYCFRKRHQNCHRRDAFLLDIRLAHHKVRAITHTSFHLKFRRSASRYMPMSGKADYFGRTRHVSRIQGVFLSG